MRRLILAATYAACLAALGCVEGEQTYTLNPDGSGKVKMDVVMSPPFEPFGPQPAKKAEDQSLDDMLRNALRPLLDTPGVTAWKDVSASFAPDGRLKFAGTAYFKKLDNFELKNTPMLGNQYGLKTGPDGALTLARKKGKDGPDSRDGLLNFGPGKKKPEELAKMSDAAVDEYIMKERVGYQTVKPILVVFLADAKLKTTYVLPGDPGQVTGFKTAGKTVYVTIDGDKIIGGIKKIYALDSAELRKVYRSKEEMTALAEATFGFAPDDTAKAVVAKPTGPQFDYDAEVKAALAAYPDLRKKLKLPEGFRLPHGTGAPGVPKS
jgi:hypothetical protein